MKEKIFAVAVIFALFAVPALADTQSFTVTFSIPSSISHSLSYGTVDGTCTNSIFYFREGDASIDGNQTGINASDASGNACQNTTVSALTVTNDGNTAVNVTELVNATVTGVVVKVSQNASQIGTQCANTNPISNCYNMTTSAALVVSNLGTSSSADLYHWADFTNANVGGGVGSAGSTTRLFTTNATSG